MYRILGTSLQSRDITVVIPSYDTWPDGDALAQASQYVFFLLFFDVSRDKDLKRTTEYENASIGANTTSHE